MNSINRVPAEVFHPGEFLRDELEARGWTQADLAEILGRPLKTVNEVIVGKKAITPETARGLAAAFGTSAQFWMNLESAYQLHRAGANEAAARDCDPKEKKEAEEYLASFFTDTDHTS